MAEQRRPVYTAGSALASRELAVLCQQMSVIVGSDITLMEGVDMIAAQCEDKHLKRVMRQISGDMQQNSATFAEAVSKQRGALPSYFVYMVQIGETSGTLEQTLTDLAVYYEKEAKVRRKLRTAVAYPALLAVLMLAVILLLVVEIFPMFSQILSEVGGDMPGITQGLLNVSAFFGRNALYIGIGLVALIALIAFILHTEGGRHLWDRIKLRVPVARKIITCMTTARLARSLAIMLRSGMPVASSLGMLNSLIENTAIARKFNAAAKSLKDGATFYDALVHMNLFPPLFMRMVMVGQKTGNLDVMLHKASGLFDDEVDTSLERLTTAVEPVLIIILSLIVGVVLLSVMLPMTRIISAMG